MQVVTLTSDYGANTYYAAALKARLIALLPNVAIVDVSHNLPSYDLLQAAFLLQNCMQEFKTETVHIIAVDTNLALHGNVVIGKNGNQWVIAADNGFLYMLGNSWDKIYRVHQHLVNVDDLSPEKNIFTTLAASILSGKSIDEIAFEATPNVVVNSLNPVFIDKQIRATIVHVDGYDNAITNLNKLQFLNWVQQSPYNIYYKRKEYLQNVEQNYFDVSQGTGIALFNDMGWLEIAINRGQGKSLLGLKIGDQIIIEKQE